MRITDIITESELSELSLAGIGKGIGKVVGGVGTAVGGVKGAIAGTKAAYSQGRQSAYDATHSAIAGRRPPATPPARPPATPPARPPATPPARPPATPPSSSSTNPFSDPVKLKQAFDDIAQQLTAGQANQLKPLIQSMYRQLGGVAEGISKTINHFEIKGVAESVKNKGAMVKDFHSAFLGKDI